ncbi:hypothetical protein AVEN_201543-1 [Araneus ventricosus]|uniref:Uncharacterized protein n=1 Tax=Araneus ventricosus TaxID=182803 RepID=A0A4Y2VB78_ARAVE|nr:hypothetical protein AVEN_201543-1 [Araneus ventricosus]
MPFFLQPLQLMDQLDGHGKLTYRWTDRKPSHSFVTATFTVNVPVGWTWHRWTDRRVHFLLIVFHPKFDTDRPFGCEDHLPNFTRPVHSLFQLSYSQTDRQ